MPLAIPYSEGLLTPTLLFGGAAVGMAGTFTGTWERIGSLVVATVKIALSAKGSSTGPATIGGLPLQVGPAPEASTAVFNANLVSALNPQVRAVPGGLTVALWRYSDINLLSMSDANFADDSLLQFTLSYKTG